MSNHVYLGKQKSIAWKCSYFDKQTPEIVLRSLFDKYDSDRNGMLTKNELFNLLQDDLGLNDEQCEIYHHLLDENADGLISYKEFSIWLQSGEEFQTISDKTRYYYLQKAVTMFKVYDTDSNLAIDKQEFRKLYEDLGGREYDQFAIDQTMSQLDLDRNGRISFQEFLKWLKWVPMEYFTGST